MHQSKGMNNNKFGFASVAFGASLLLAPVLLGGSTGCASTYSNLSDAHTARVSAADTAIEETPDNADLAVYRERVIAVSAECAYDTLADITTWNEWDPAVSSARMVEGETVAVGNVFFQDLGDFQFNAQVLAADRGRLLRWRGQDPSGSGPVGIHSWTFIPKADGTTLVINDEHFHAWFLNPLGWVTDLGISEQFDVSMASLETAAQERCGS
jgi:hypothetical protein